MTRNRILRPTARTLMGFVTITLACGLAASLTSCASVQQAIQGYGTVAVTGAHAAADTVVQAQKVALCDLPYSAIQRHPEINPAVESLCGPLTTTVVK